MLFVLTYQRVSVSAFSDCPSYSVSAVDVAVAWREYREPQGCDVPACSRRPNRIGRLTSYLLQCSDDFMRCCCVGVRRLAYSGNSLAELTPLGSDGSIDRRSVGYKAVYRRP